VVTRCEYLVASSEVAPAAVRSEVPDPGGKIKLNLHSTKKVLGSLPSEECEELFDEADLKYIGAIDSKVK